jgi:crossover junction endodeoxyribonuclease RuvC
MVILGIDPGLTGACAIYRPHSTTVDFLDMPVVGEGLKSRVNVLDLSIWIRRFSPTVACIELVAAMPSIPGPNGERRSMGAASAMKFGDTVGSIRSTVILCGIPLAKQPTPQSWKKHFGLKGSDKENSRLAALNLFPAAAPQLARKKDHARAEALLIARYHADRAPMPVQEQLFEASA